MEILVPTKTGSVKALVSAEDFERLHALKWHVSTGYAINKALGSMHSIVIGGVKHGHVIDHIDRNKLNNQRDNLRYVSKSVNAQNIDTNSEHQGVGYDKSRNQWVARFSRHFIGRYDTREEAARAYDGYVLSISSHYSTNFSDSTPIERPRNPPKTLPTGITQAGNSFYVRITHKRTLYREGPFKDLEDALASLSGIRERIKETLVTVSTTSTISLRDKNGDTIAVCSVDPHISVELNRYRWCLDRSTGYAFATMNNKTVKMHKYVASNYLADTPPEDNMVIDHINGNKLDNRIENLRYATYSQNVQNRRAMNNGRVGVRNSVTKGKYTASCGGKYLGTFSSLYDAMIAYNKRALELYGEHAFLNDVSSMACSGVSGGG